MVVWIIGLSGAGKTTLGMEVVSQAKSLIPNLAFIDGDLIRELFGNDLGYSMTDRRKNAERISNLCKFLQDQDINVVCAILSLFHESQEWNRKNIIDYFEVYIDAPFEQLVDRDTKGLYAGALRGKLTNVAGVDIEFVPPKHPDLVINNSGALSELLAFAPVIVSKIAGQK